MKKVFIDIGGHFGESVEKFYNEVPDAEEWIIYSFEPLTFEKLIENTSKYSNVTVIPAAAWIEEGELDIYIGERKEGLGSTVLKGKRTGDIDYAKPVKAKAIDVNMWLSQLQADYIVMKVNIEGGEYVLLPYLIENNVFTSIDELYVETHAEKFDGELGKVWKDVERNVIEDLKKFKTRTQFYINKKYTFSVANIFHKKPYKNYKEYLAKQREKLDKGIPWLGEYIAAYEVLLKRCLAGLFLGKTCLCLGARLGTEVKVFNSLGIFTVGIDLNPGESNKYVVTGDASEIQYPDSSVDMVYTNSLDHFLKIEKVTEEIKRVLVPNGYFLFLVADMHYEDKYDAISWKNVESLIKYFEKTGFSVVERKNPDSIIWFDNFIVMRKEE